MTDGATLWRATGNTDPSSFAKAISRSVQPGSSPMAREAAAIYDVLRPYGLTRLGAAMSWHERKNDTWGPSYGLDSTFKNPWALRCNMQADSCRNGWSAYNSYVRAAAVWADRIMKRPGLYDQTRTLADLVHVYAPDTDGNNEKAYVEVVAREIDALPLQQGGEMATNPFPTPTIYDLRNNADAARYSLTPAERDRLLLKCSTRSGTAPKVIVLHIQDGVTAGSLDWWANNVNASATVLANKDGSIVNCIDPASAPWTTGDVESPTAVGQRVINSFGPAPNLYSLTIEAEGRPADAMPQAQLNAICWQVTEWMNRYSIPLMNVVRHSDFNTVDRSYCPGQYADRVIATLMKGGTTVPWPGKPTWLPDDLVKELFPEATPEGPRTKAWFEHMQDVGLAPRRVKWHFRGTDREVIEFSNGLLIYKDGLTSEDLWRAG